MQHGGEAFGVAPVLCGRIAGHAPHPVEVAAGRETLAGGAQANGAHRAIAAEALESGGKIGDQGVVEGVMDVRPVQGHPAGASVVDLDEEGSVHLGLTS